MPTIVALEARKLAISTLGAVVKFDHMTVLEIIHAARKSGGTGKLFQQLVGNRNRHYDYTMSTSIIFDFFIVFCNV